MAVRFKIGDAVVHPVRGAGVVERVVERRWRGSSAPYYRIRLLGQRGTRLMVPAGAAEELGLRRVISQSRLKRLWRVLLGDPERLPDEHKERYQVLKDRLGTGDPFQVAEAVRDLAWRERRKGHLTTRGKQIYETAVRLLAGEIAAAESVDFVDAETRVKARLREGLLSATAA